MQCAGLLSSSSLRRLAAPAARLLTMLLLSAAAPAPGAHAPCCSNFYERLKEVKEYHRKFPDDDLTEVGGLRC